jgi:hypothetical protein
VLVFIGSLLCCCAVGVVGLGGGGGGGRPPPPPPPPSPRNKVLGTGCKQLIGANGYGVVYKHSAYTVSGIMVLARVGYYIPRAGWPGEKNISTLWL